MINKMISVQEASEMLKISERTIYRLIEKGEIGVVRVTPKNLLIKEEEMLRFLESRYERKGQEGASNGAKVG